MLNAIIKIMLQRPKHSINSFGDFSLPGYIKEATDDGDGGATSDLFDVSGEADSVLLKGKFAPIDSNLHNRAPRNDEDDPMPDTALPEPTSQPHEQEYSTSLPSFPQLVTSLSLVDGPQCAGRKLSTSSDVSVRVEVEDRPLLEYRNLWPSQLFIPIETSPF